MVRGMFSAGYLWKKIGAVVKKSWSADQDTPMRILICSNLFPPHVTGDAEMVAYRHAKVLKEWGQDVRIFCGRLGDTASRPYQIETEKGEFYVTRVSLPPWDLSGALWHYDNHQIRQAFAKTLNKFSPNIVHFHTSVGLSVEMIDECHRRGIPTVMTLHDPWGICLKSVTLKHDGAVCTHGAFDCTETRTEALAIPSPIRNAHILLSLRKVDRLIAPSEHLAEMYAANGISREQIAVFKQGINFQCDLRIQVAHILAIFRELDAASRVARPRDADILLADADHHWNPYLRQMLHSFAALEARLQKRLLVCRADLSDADTLGGGKLLLLTSACQDALSHALRAFERQIPIVACANVRELRGLCLASNAGVFYEDHDALQECLALLLSNEPLRHAMGMNGRNFVKSLRRATRVSSKQSHTLT